MSNSNKRSNLAHSPVVRRTINLQRVIDVSLLIIFTSLLINIIYQLVFKINESLLETNFAFRAIGFITANTLLLSFFVKFYYGNGDVKVLEKSKLIRRSKVIK